MWNRKNKFTFKYTFTYVPLEHAKNGRLKHLRCATTDKWQKWDGLTESHVWRSPAKIGKQIVILWKQFVSMRICGNNMRKYGLCNRGYLTAVNMFKLIVEGKLALAEDQEWHICNKQYNMAAAKIVENSPFN